MVMIVMEDEICEIGIEEYSKCADIWNMKKCPFTEDFKNQIKEGLFPFCETINISFLLDHLKTY